MYADIWTCHQWDSLQFHIPSPCTNFSHASTIFLERNLVLYKRFKIFTMRLQKECISTIQNQTSHFCPCVNIKLHYIYEIPPQLLSKFQWNNDLPSTRDSIKYINKYKSHHAHKCSYIRNITAAAAVYNHLSRIIQKHANELIQKSFNHQKYLFLVIFQPPQRLRHGLDTIYK